MTALWILEALSRCGIEAGAWGIIPMGKDYPFKQFFGGRPIHKFEPGRYVYVKAVHISDDAFGYLDNAADHTIFGADPEEECTMLFKIEDDPIK
jgi:hypothetical protein